MRRKQGLTAHSLPLLTTHSLFCPLPLPSPPLSPFGPSPGLRQHLSACSSCPKAGWGTSLHCPNPIFDPSALPEDVINLFTKQCTVFLINHSPSLQQHLFPVMPQCSLKHLGHLSVIWMRSCTQAHDFLLFWYFGGHAWPQAGAAGRLGKGNSFPSAGGAVPRCHQLLR